MRLRRMLFQVHLWLGLAVGLYVFIISLSGSLIVFRRELDRILCSRTCEPGFISWLAEFHDHLAIGRAGLFINGLGAVVVTVMSLTGAVIWWPGRTRWRRSLIVHRGVSTRRFILELHNVLGMWLLLLILLWCVTGIYFAFPGPFNALDDHLLAGRMQTGASQFLENSIAWMVRLHFGRAYGTWVEWLWVILGLVPCVLFVTGTLMWWIRMRPPHKGNRA